MGIYQLAYNDIVYCDILYCDPVISPYSSQYTPLIKKTTFEPDRHDN